MKFYIPISLLIILTMTVFLLTACGNSTSYINDQRGKAISVTASDSDTYTFKLSGVPMEEAPEPVIEVVEETVPEEPQTPEKPIEAPVIPKEEPAATGPKTGEP